MPSISISRASATDGVPCHTRCVRFAPLDAFRQLVLAHIGRGARRALSTETGTIAKPGARGHAGDHGQVGRKFQRPRRRHDAFAQPLREQAAIRTTQREGDQRGVGEVAGSGDGAHTARSDQHQFFLEHRQGFEPGRGEGLGHEGGLDIESLYPLQQCAGRAGHQLDHHSRVKPVEARQHRRQPATRRAFERTQPEGAERKIAAQFTLRLIGQAQQAIGIGQQLMAGRCERERAPLAVEQLVAQSLFELLDAGRDIRLHAIELVRRADHAALRHDGAEDLQGSRDRSFS